MRCWLAALGLLVASTAHAQPAKERDYAADEAVLREQSLPTDGRGLVDIFRSRIPSPATIAQFKKHVAGLRASAYADRLKASADLKKMGPVVRPLLENALLDLKADAETMRRLRQVLEEFPADKDFSATVAAAHLIGRDQPRGSLSVLLDFVPYAENENIRREVQRAIDRVALVNKKVAPLLVAAVKDANPAKRAAAGEALLRAVGPSATDKLGDLLNDPHPLVRYQIGMALIEKNDKSGLPLLIQAMAKSPSDRVEAALDLLCRVAGDDAPAVYYEGKHSSAAVGAAWTKWYDKHHAKLDLAKQLAKSEMGFTLIALYGPTAKKGGLLGASSKIFEIGGSDNAVRWEFDGPRNVRNARVIGPNRLLLAEYTDRRVTERDFKGNILKQFPVAMPVACQRLPNGDTFIATRQLLLIVDRDGKEVFTWTPQGPSITTAQRLRNGQTVVVTPGRCQLLDPQGRELKSFNMGGSLYTLGSNVEVLPNGRILVPLYTQSAVVEFDWNGNKLWHQGDLPGPTGATRLSNGNTLVTCALGRSIIEIDPQGKQVWSYNPEGRPVRARKR